VILLDTHVVLWLTTRPKRLSRPAAAAIRRGERGGLAIASATLMELAQILAGGRVTTGDTPQAWMRSLLERTGVAVKEITIDTAAVAAHLPASFPADPFDRLIAATAMVERMALVTSDERIRRSGVVKTIW
jgi:PIN domain nuclease of toxin-antitoxin system